MVWNLVDPALAYKWDGQVGQVYVERRMQQKLQKINNGRTKWEGFSTSIFFPHHQ